MPRNPYLCLAIVLTLATVSLLGMIGIFVLNFVNKPTPAEMVALVSGSIGSLSSFLVSVPRGSVGNRDGQPPE